MACQNRTARNDELLSLCPHNIMCYEKIVVLSFKRKHDLASTVNVLIFGTDLPFSNQSPSNTLHNEFRTKRLYL